MGAARGYSRGSREGDNRSMLYDILRGMSKYDWDSYKHALESRGYKVHEQRDKQGVLHGYTVLRGNSRFKSSILGKSRSLTVPKLEATWKKLHPVAPSVMKPSSSVGTSQTTERKPITERDSKRQSVTQTESEVPSVFRKILSVDGKSYSIKMPMEAYKAMEDAIEVPDESMPFENVLNVAMQPPQFLNPVVAVVPLHQTGARTRMMMNVTGHDAVFNMPSGYVSQSKEVKDMDVKHKPI